MNANTILTAIHTMIIAIVGGMIGVVADIRWWFHDHRDEIVVSVDRFMEGLANMLDAIWHFILASLCGAIRIGFLITIVMMVIGVPELTTVQSAPTLSAIAQGAVQLAESGTTAVLQMVNQMFSMRDIPGGFGIFIHWCMDELHLLLAWLATFSC